MFSDNITRGSVFMTSPNFPPTKALTACFIKTCQYCDI